MIANLDVPRDRLEHLRPILLAMRDHGVAFAIVPQGKITFELPRPDSICVIGDDLIEAKGPAAFDRLSLQRAVRRAEAAVIVSSEAHVLPYATAAALAVGLGSNVILVETLPTRELEWTAFIERYGRHHPHDDHGQAGGPAAVTDAKAVARDYVVEMLGMVILHAEVAQRVAEVPDDTGTGYARRRLVAHVRAATSTFNELIVPKPAKDADVQQ